MMKTAIGYQKVNGMIWTMVNPNLDGAKITWIMDVKVRKRIIRFPLTRLHTDWWFVLVFFNIPLRNWLLNYL